MELSGFYSLILVISILALIINILGLLIIILQRRDIRNFVDKAGQERNFLAQLNANVDDKVSRLLAGKVDYIVRSEAENADKP